MIDSAGLPRRARMAEAALVLVTLLWGMSFPWMKSWQNAAGAEATLGDDGRTFAAVASARGRRTECP